MKPERLNLLADVAEMYYIHGEDQSAVAQKFGVTRSMVSRMLNDARKQGLVKITIDRPINQNQKIEEALCNKYGLHRAIVVEQPGDIASLSYIGKAAAHAIGQHLCAGQVLGVSWGTAVSATVDEFYSELPIPGVRIVQLLGSLGARIREYHGISIVHRLADKIGGEGIYLNAPVLVENAELAQVLKESKDIYEALSLGEQADLAVLGIGSAAPTVSPYIIGGYFPRQEMEAMFSNGAVGDVCGLFFDINGRAMNSALQERVIGIAVVGLKKIPLRVGIAGGTEKVRPIIGALRGNYVNTLITDSVTAQIVLDFESKE
jgi:DNA-binding transcriptional regulator LsrR (DeoR family)